MTSPPNVYFELMGIINDPNKSLIDVGLIIENDPSLSIRLLKIVNSAFYNFPAQIGSITRAISIIGNKELQNLVLATVIIDKFSSQPGGLLTMHDFWARSVRCALLSKEIFKFLYPQEINDSVFVCGLLHDIGQLVFYRRIPVLAREVGLYVEATGMSETEAEENLIGFNHFDTGAELARRWNLPADIIESLARHTQLDYQGEYVHIVDTVRMANNICKMDMLDADQFVSCKDTPADDLNEIIGRVHEQFELIFKLFYPD